MVRFVQRVQHPLLSRLLQRRLWAKWLLSVVYPFPSDAEVIVPAFRVLRGNVYMRFQLASGGAFTGVRPYANADVRTYIDLVGFIASV